MHANCFAIIEPGTTLAIASTYGALLHACREGPVAWADGPGTGDLFGF